MKVVSFVIRIYSLLFHLVVSLFLLGLAIVASSSSGAELKLGMTPWEGSSLVTALYALGLIGLVIVALTFRGILRFLFLIWSLVVLYLLVNGYFLNTTYRFGGEDEFRFAIYLSLGAFVAFLGSILLLKSPLFAKRPAKG